MKKILLSLVACVCVVLAVAMVLPGFTAFAQEESTSALIGASLYLDDQADLIFCFDPAKIDEKGGKDAFEFTVEMDGETLAFKGSDLKAMTLDNSGFVYQTITLEEMSAVHYNTLITYSGNMNETNSFTLTSLARGAVSYYTNEAKTSKTDYTTMIDMLKAFANYSVAVDNQKNGTQKKIPYANLTATDPAFTESYGNLTQDQSSVATFTSRSFVLGDDVYLQYNGTVNSGSIDDWTITFNSVNITNTLEPDGNNFSFTVPLQAEQGTDKIRLTVRNSSGVIYDRVEKADAIAKKLGDFEGYEALSGALTTYLQKVSAYAKNPTVEAEREFEAAFYAGFGRADITPYTDSVMMNFTYDNNKYYYYSDEFIDPIYATCVALRDANGEIALIYSLDIRNLQRWVDDSYKNTSKYPGSPYEEIKKIAVGSFPDLKEDNIFFNATHNHNSPNVDKVDDPSIISWYKNIFYPGVKEATKKALADLTEVTGAYTNSGNTGEDTNYNRRYTYVRNGWDYDIENYEDARDREMRTIRFERGGAKDILLVNWQAHAANGSHLTNDTTHKAKGTSDFVGSLRREVEDEHDVHFLYVNGASGDLNMTGNSYLATKPNLEPDGENQFREELNGKDGINFTKVGQSLAETVNDLLQNKNNKQKEIKAENLGAITVKSISTSSGTSLPEGEGVVRASDGKLNLKFRQHINGSYCQLRSQSTPCPECNGRYRAMTYNNTTTSVLYSPNGASGYAAKGEYKGTDIEGNPVTYQYYKSNNGTITETKKVTTNGVTYYRYKGYVSSTYYGGAKDQLNDYNAEKQPDEFTLSTLTIGDAIGFAFCPYEMFNQNGVDIRNAFGTDKTIFIGAYTNGYLGYVASKEAFTKVENTPASAFQDNLGDDGSQEVSVTKFPKGCAEYFAKLLEINLW